MYRGFLAQQLIAEQEHYIRTLPQHDKDPAKPTASNNKAEWSSAVIRSIFLKQAHALWIDRCQTTHAKEEKRETKQQ